MDCIGCGLCPSICPLVFELHTGRAKIIEGTKLKANLTCIKDAMINCPVQAIEIKDYDQNKK